MIGKFRIVPFLKGILGAAVGGVVGYYAFGWVLSQGFYAMVIPGAALGYGFGLLSRDRSTVYGIVCAILAVGLGLFTEWKFFPFIKDGSFNYFITHIHELIPVTLIMIALGGLCGYWFGIGRTTVPSRR
jgi:hypothetical protein